MEELQLADLYKIISDTVSYVIFLWLFLRERNRVTVVQEARVSELSMLLRIYQSDFALPSGEREKAMSSETTPKI